MLETGRYAERVLNLSWAGLTARQGGKGTSMSNRILLGVVAALVMTGAAACTKSEPTTPAPAPAEKPATPPPAAAKPADKPADKPATMAGEAAKPATPPPAAAKPAEPAAPKPPGDAKPEAPKPDADADET